MGARLLCACKAYLLSVVKYATKGKQDQEQPEVSISDKSHRFSLKMLMPSREVFQGKPTPFQAV
ncbi:hypothetical protein ES703_54132 [subsurface metagenome]